MSDTTSTDKTLRVGTRKPLSLKRDTDTVRQSFSGGRSKAVGGEKKRSRVAGPTKRPELHAPVGESPPVVEAARPRADQAPGSSEADAHQGRAGRTSARKADRHQRTRNLRKRARAFARFRATQAREAAASGARLYADAGEDRSRRGDPGGDHRAGA